MAFSMNLLVLRMGLNRLQLLSNVETLKISLILFLQNFESNVPTSEIENLAVEMFLKRDTISFYKYQPKICFIQEIMFCKEKHKFSFICLDLFNNVRATRWRLAIIHTKM